jgi:hypothetical protein
MYYYWLYSRNRMQTIKIKKLPEFPSCLHFLWRIQLCHVHDGLKLAAILFLWLPHLWLLQHKKTSCREHNEHKNWDTHVDILENSLEFYTLPVTTPTLSGGWSEMWEVIMTLQEPKFSNQGGVCDIHDTDKWIQVLERKYEGMWPLERQIQLG